MYTASSTNHRDGLASMIDVVAILESDRWPWPFNMSIGRKTLVFKRYHCWHWRCCRCIFKFTLQKTIINQLCITEICTVHWLSFNQVWIWLDNMVAKVVASCSKRANAWDNDFLEGLGVTWDNRLALCVCFSLVASYWLLWGQKNLHSVPCVFFAVACMVWFAFFLGIAFVKGSLEVLTSDYTESCR